MQGRGAAGTGSVRYDFIDLMKFICAILVVTIHVPPFKSVSGTLNFYVTQYLARLAVPFYFTAAGFFLFRKLEPGRLDPAIPEKYVFKLLRLYATWMILLFYGYTLQLWFLPALAVAVILVSLLAYRKVSPRGILLICFGLFLIGLLGNAYSPLFERMRSVGVIDRVASLYGKYFGTTRNGVFMGSVYVALGMVFAWRPPKLGLRALLAGFVVSLALMFAEVTLLRRRLGVEALDMCLMQLPATYFLFALSLAMNLPRKPIYRALSTIGTLVFYLHLLVLAFLHDAAQHFGGALLAPSSHSFVSFVVVTGVTLLVAFAIYRLSKRPKFGWLAKLYS